MILQKIHIVGFRNFKNCQINFSEKSLIIGPNDIGKSNLLYAIRLLLDRSIPEISLEPVESDFYAHENQQNIQITGYFAEAVEDCILSKFREHISDDQQLIIRYEGYRTQVDENKSYKLFCGPSEKRLSEIDSRFYLRALNCVYIDSNRDLDAFLRREKKNLLQKSKEERTPEEIVGDERTLTEIATTLKKVDDKVTDLSYISSATDGLNSELNEISVTNSNVKVQFDTGSSDTKLYVDNLKLVSRYDETTVALGGDGRNNQVYLAMWAAQRNKDYEKPTEVSINCIEEPEAHLHPHQQRKLSQYLITKLKGQVVISSHSPQIASIFDSSSIINLYKNGRDSKAARDGCSAEIQDKIKSFGHRLNVIPAEGFFSTVVFLVEGVSEIIFYKALAKALDIDLDKHNISLISVEGVGFKVYFDLYSSLGIRVVVRTDFDITKIKGKEMYRSAGLSRLVEIYKTFNEEVSAVETSLQSLAERHLNLEKKEIPAHLDELINDLELSLSNLGLYVSEKDLEWDLINSKIKNNLLKWYGKDAKELNALHEAMTQHKATNMFEYLAENHEVLKDLSGDPISRPLRFCVDYSIGLHE